MKTKFLFEAGAFGKYRDIAARGPKGAQDLIKKDIAKELTLEGRFKVFNENLERYTSCFVKFLGSINKDLSTAWAEIASASEDKNVRYISVGEAAMMNDADFPIAVRNIYLDPTYVLTGVIKKKFILPIVVSSSSYSSDWTTSQIVDVYKFLDKVLPVLHNTIHKKIDALITELNEPMFFATPDSVVFGLYPNLYKENNLSPNTESHSALAREINNRTKETTPSTSLAGSPLIFDIFKQIPCFNLNVLNIKDYKSFSVFKTFNREYLANTPKFVFYHIKCDKEDILGNTEGLKAFEEFLNYPNVMAVPVPYSWVSKKTMQISVQDYLKNYKDILKMKEVFAKYPIISKMQKQFVLRDVSAYVQTTIGKQLSQSEATDAGIDMASIKRSVYALDYDDPMACKEVVIKLLDELKNSQSELKIDEYLEHQIKEQLPSKFKNAMSKLVKGKPYYATRDNKIILCDATRKSNNNVKFGLCDASFINSTNILRLTFSLDLSVAVTGINPRYGISDYGGYMKYRNAGKNYEFLAGRKMNVDIKL
jgi:hypothetical protein